MQSVAQIVGRRKQKRNQWLEKRRNDGFVARAQRQNYRTRAVFKLQEIDRRDRLIRPGMTVLELGAAPGGWSQYTGERVGPGGRVVAVDLLPMQPVDNVVSMQADLMEAGTQQELAGLIGGSADLVLSDMAPNITGIAEADQARFLDLLNATLDLSRRILRPGGNMLVKVFEGPQAQEFRKRCAREFATVTVRKPAASKSASREYYLLAVGLLRAG